MDFSVFTAPDYNVISFVMCLPTALRHSPRLRPMTLFATSKTFGHTMHAEKMRATGASTFRTVHVRFFMLFAKTFRWDLEMKEERLVDNISAEIQE